ncbi:MAG: c-type cytochrome [Bacteroidota bacterium]|nr:c-type cytochrome [Bacteroidota bacterium]
MLLFAVFLIVTGSGLIGCNKKTDNKSEASKDSTSAKAPAMSPAERGKYLVTIASCNDCHTPWKMGPQGPEQDLTRMLSGHPESMKMPPPPKMNMPWMVAGAATLTAWSTPAGVAYTANLTPDSATGIGKWDETTFMLAIRNGKHIGNGRPIMPPMPWEFIKQMTDEDLKAVYAYLRTIPPIHNQVPEPIMAPPPPGMAGGDMKHK